MLTARGVPFLKCVEAPRSDFARHADDGRPEPSMHVRDLAANEPADEDVGGIADAPGQREDLLSSGMAPPAAAHTRARDRVRERRDPRAGDVRRLQHDAATPDKGDCLSGRHQYSRSKSTWCRSG